VILLVREYCDGGEELDFLEDRNILTNYSKADLVVSGVSTPTPPPSLQGLYGSANGSRRQ